MALPGRLRHMAAAPLRWPRTHLGCAAVESDSRRAANKNEINMRLLLLILALVLLVGALPTWPYSSGWGYYPAGGVGDAYSRIRSP